MGEKWFHAFLKGISPKLNIMMQLVFELAYNNVTIQHVRHNRRETPIVYLSA